MCVVKIYPLNLINYLKRGQTLQKKINEQTKWSGWEPNKRIGVNRSRLNKKEEPRYIEEIMKLLAFPNRWIIE